MRVLIAEDDLTARTILSGLLRKWGFEVETAIDGLAAWQVLQQPGAPLLVLMDWIMPGLEGLEVIEKVRAQNSECPPYIILLTSRDQKGDIYRGLEAGANDYIKKPFDNEELFARLRVGQRSVEMQTRLLETQQTLSHLAAHDPLTGVFNRRAVLELLSRELSRVARREGAGLSIGYFDIDNFKTINDHYGHQVGDEVLKCMVDVLTSNLRTYDILGRLGGDEFLVIAPETSGENTALLFERMAKCVADLKVKTSAGEVSVTISIGVAEATKTTSLDHLIEAADAAMYRAKNSGRNQVNFNNGPL